MSRLERYQGRAQAALNRNADLLFPNAEPWSDGTTCRFGIKDPNKDGGGKGFTRLATDPLPASLRLLKVQPGDPVPTPGATVPYQGGTLVLAHWSDESAYTGQRVGVCRLVDERAYPLLAFGAGGYFRLRITALDAASATTGSNDLVAEADNSHRAHLPPGVRLEPGEQLTTSEGDAYLVVPPVQRDSLGDTLGLSWQRSGAVYPLPPASGAGAAEPAPAPPNPDDAWWKDGL